MKKVDSSGTTYFPKTNQVTSFLSQKIANVARAFFDALTRLYEFFFKKAPAEKTVEAVVMTPNSNTGSAVSSADRVAEESLRGSLSPAAVAVEGSPRSNSPPLPLEVAVEEVEVEDDAPIVHVDPAQAIVSAENKEKMKQHIKEAAGVINKAMYGTKTKALWGWYKKNTNPELPKDEQLPATHEMVVLIKALIKDEDQDLKNEIKDVLYIIYDSNLLKGIAKLASRYSDLSVFKQEYFGSEEIQKSFHTSEITEEQMQKLHEHFKKGQFKQMCQGLFPELSIK